MRSAVFIAALALCAALFALLAGCPGRLDDPDSFILGTCGGEGQPVCTTSTSTIPPLLTVFRPRCGIPGCHAPPAPQSDLDLYSGGLAVRLVNVTSTSAICNGRIFVVAGNPAQSLIFGKVAGPVPCGVQMPIGPMLPQEELDAIRLWIEALRPME